MGQAIYEKQQAEAAPADEGAAAGSEAGGDEDVVDAEFSEVDGDSEGETKSS